jgi:hypothetical protein
MLNVTLPAQNIISNGEPAELNIRKAGENSIRITIKPVSFKAEFPFSPALSFIQYSKPAISLRSVDKTIKKQVGNLKVEITSNPLSRPKFYAGYNKVPKSGSFGPRIWLHFPT